MNKRAMPSNGERTVPSDVNSVAQSNASDIMSQTRLVSHTDVFASPERATDPFTYDTARRAIQHQLLMQEPTLSASAALLEANLLVEHVCRVSRTALYTNPECPLTTTQSQQLKSLLARRLAGEPMAYLLGTQDFWTLTFCVTPQTLIPRADTECLIRWVLEQTVGSAALKKQNKNKKTSAKEGLRVADLGTGSGAIALTLAYERPDWAITATDISEAALAVAQQNAARLLGSTLHPVTAQSRVAFYLGHWCEALPTDERYDMIVANPPYIPEHDPHLTELTHEPRVALCSGVDGLDAIRDIIAAAPRHLKAGGQLILEHGYDQAEAVCALLHAADFDQITSHTDLAERSRFVTAVYFDK